MRERDGEDDPRRFWSGRNGRARFYFGLVGFWMGLVGFGLVGFGLVGFGLVGFGLVGFWMGFSWIWFGWVWLVFFSVYY